MTKLMTRMIATRGSSLQSVSDPPRPPTGMAAVTRRRRQRPSRGSERPPLRGSTWLVLLLHLLLLSLLPLVFLVTPGRLPRGLRR